MEDLTDTKISKDTGDLKMQLASFIYELYTKHCTYCLNNYSINIKISNKENLKIVCIYIYMYFLQNNELINTNLHWEEEGFNQRDWAYEEKGDLNFKSSIKFLN